MGSENLFYTVKNTLKIGKIEICIIVIFLATLIRFSLKTNQIFFNFVPFKILVLL
jgi:hypothetical protein